ncbi:hypothetical protein AC69_3247 [Escherichia coli 2-177-06_S4_C1]|nr:hypothetical protein AC69_3247 [Escherichia coli 2-177-06_S4_C1]
MVLSLPLLMVMIKSTFLDRCVENHHYLDILMRYNHTVP